MGARNRIGVGWSSEVLWQHGAAMAMQQRTEWALGSVSTVLRGQRSLGGLALGRVGHALGKQVGELAGPRGVANGHMELGHSQARLAGWAGAKGRFWPKGTIGFKILGHFPNLFFQFPN
jgi:hypothetical protein